MLVNLAHIANMGHNRNAKLARQQANRSVVVGLFPALRPGSTLDRAYREYPFQPGWAGRGLPVRPPTLVTASRDIGCGYSNSMPLFVLL